MKKYLTLPIILSALLFIGYAGRKAKLAKDDSKSPVFKHLTDVDGVGPVTIPEVYRFAELPLVYEGRVKPFDTLARNTLRVLSDSEDIYRPANNDKNVSGMSRMFGSTKMKVPPIVWLPRCYI